MIAFMEAKERVKEPEKCLDSQLWHACAGGMVQMPAVNSRIFYFPQGHAEHASTPVDFRDLPGLPPYIGCRVSAIKFMADSETDEVYSRLKLVPITTTDAQVIGEDEEEGVINGAQSQENKPASFAKTLTQSDANNGGGFSVPRYCAETIFPPLDYSADPPVQTILAKDVHGETWKFRHIYRGTPRRHLLTTGWSAFVNHKKLVAGDSIVFLRADNGDLCVGIRRAKGGMGGSPEPSWNPGYGGFGGLFRDDESKLLRSGKSGLKGKVSAESVAEAAALAAKGQPFEVVYYPRASAPEFCVKASMVKAALQIRWCSGMRFKMPFETEDSSRISWFMGTISSVSVVDHLRWPDSPWRLLQVTWDEPDLLQNVKRVSPWLVELVPNMPAIHLSPFSPQRKKLRLPQHLDFALESHFPIPGFSGSPFGCIPENIPAGMQGARHAHYNFPLSDLKLQTSLLPPALQKPSMSETVSCVLTMANSAQGLKKPEDVKTPHLVLFGQPILTEEQISLENRKVIDYTNGSGQ